jgi:hypothetical protein
MISDRYRSCKSRDRSAAARPLLQPQGGEASSKLVSSSTKCLRFQGVFLHLVAIEHRNGPDLVAHTIVLISRLADSGGERSGMTPNASGAVWSRGPDS